MQSRLMPQAAHDEVSVGSLCDLTMEDTTAFVMQSMQDNRFESQQHTLQVSSIFRRLFTCKSKIILASLWIILYASTG